MRAFLCTREVSVNSEHEILNQCLINVDPRTEMVKIFIKDVDP